MTDLRRRSNAWYGYKRDMRDPRDVAYMPEWAEPPPRSTALLQHLPPATNQGELGSCVFNACQAAVRVLLHKAGKPDFVISRLQHYYETRKIEDTLKEDAGAEVRDAIKVIVEQGVGPEKLWPYDLKKFKHPPPPAVYDEKVDIEAIEYQRVTVNPRAIRTAIASKFPIIFGITLFESFEGLQVEKTGVVPVPDLKAEEAVGGHCMLAVAYDDKDNVIALNSWGDDWGDHGLCKIPMAIVGSTAYGGDYWIMRLVENR